MSHEKGEKLYQLAEQRLPESWLEKHVWLTYLLAFLIYLGSSYVNEGVNPEENVPYIALTVLAYLTSTFFDVYSTTQVLAEVEELASQEIAVPLYESSNFLPNRPTKKDIYGYKYLTINLLLLLPIVFHPPLGALLTVQKLIAITNNYRVKKRLEFILEKLDKKSDHSE